MTEAYCGIGKPTKKQRNGTVKECVEKGQVRMYGIKKIDKSILEKMDKTKKLSKMRESLILKMVGLRVKVKKNKLGYEKTKKDDLRPKYYEDWKQAEKELNSVLTKLKKVEEQRVSTSSASGTGNKKKERDTKLKREIRRSSLGA